MPQAEKRQSAMACSGDGGRPGRGEPSNELGGPPGGLNGDALLATGIARVARFRAEYAGL
jgi:hypothetical protein